MAIASYLQPLSVCIPSGKYCPECWLTVTPKHFVMYCINLVAQVLILRSMEYEAKHNLHEVAIPGVLVKLSS